MIAQLTGNESGATDRFSGGGGDIAGQAQQNFGQEAGSQYRGARGLDPEFIKSLEKQYGFDKPAYERFWKMIWDFSRFDFGQSYFRDAKVLDLIAEKLPVSISIGLWVTLLSYLDLDPARHPQGHEGRLAIRLVDQRRSSSSAMPFPASSSPCSW